MAVCATALVIVALVACTAKGPTQDTGPVGDGGATIDSGADTGTGLGDGNLSVSRRRPASWCPTWSS